jgi:hypothetical protein
VGIGEHENFERKETDMRSNQNLKQVTGGQNTPGSSNSNVPALYRAISVVHRFPYRGSRYNCVSIYWFVDRRETPVAPYEQVIEGYANLSERDQHMAQTIADEALTAEEVELLREYLHRVHDDCIWTRSVDLPIKNVNGTMPFGGVPAGGGCDFYMMPEEDGYDLPFRVWGYFDVRDCPIAPERPDQGVNLSPDTDDIDSFPF